MIKKQRMIAGAAAAFVYILAVVAGGAIRPGYDHVSQFVSELIATGAPNKMLLDPIFAVYNILTMVFGWALFDFVRSLKRNPKKNIGIAGALIILAEGVFGLATLFFPQDPIGQTMTPTGTFHIILAGLSSLTTMAGMLLLGLWFNASPTLRRYGLYSFVSVGFVFISGGLTAAMTASQSPISGLLERLTIGGFLQWMALVSLGLFFKLRALENEPNTGTVPIK